VQEWEVGTEVRGIIAAWSDQDFAVAWADMRLDSITVVAEPSILALLSIGSAVFCLRRRRAATKPLE
jgi:hypothetical protein